MGDPFEWLDATAQAELVRRGEVAAVELVDAAIARIERRDPPLNAVIHRFFDRAHATALDPALPSGPFRGVPFLLKDGVAHSAGDPYHCGMRVLRDAAWMARDDTWLVQRFRRAGLVICGKTNLPELAASSTTEPLAYGATRNPWDPTRSPGGSSGGAAAAVASGMVPVAHGNDMGGSIRVPASACGLVGLKPTRARTTLGPHFGEYWGPTTHEFVLARSVRDAAGMLDAVAGPGVGDPYTAPPPARPFAAEVGANPGHLRVGFRTARRGDRAPSHPACVAAVDGVAALLADLGHHVEPEEMAALDDDRLDRGFGTAFSAYLARDVDRWSARLGRRIGADELEPWTAMIVDVGRSISASGYLESIELMQSWSRTVVSWWDHHDVLVLPTMAAPPLPLGVIGPDRDPTSAIDELSGTVTFTVPFNVTGQPAVSLPLHWDEEGLPIGVQLVAAPGREDVLLRLAAQLEAARPWADRHPLLDERPGRDERRSP